MGESRKEALKLGFDSSIRLEFHGATVSSDGGLLAYRDLDDALGLTMTAVTALRDWRTGTNIRHSMTALLRQSVYSRLAGYEDVNDAERLSQDPTFRLIGSEKIWERGAALTSRLQSFETELLTQEGNLKGLTLINRELIAKAEAIDSPQRVDSLLNFKSFFFLEGCGKPLSF